MGKVNVDKFRQLTTQYRLISIDSSCFIYHIEENKRYVPFTEIIFEQLLPSGRLKAVCSPLVLTEVLTRPYQARRQDLVIAYKALIFSFPNLGFISINGEIADKAAYFRAHYNLRTPDALHIATGFSAQAEAIVCNDLKWKRVKEMDILLLDEF